jgi:hypothetical protein
MTIATAAGIALGAAVYIGTVLLICRFLTLTHGDIHHDDHD